MSSSRADAFDRFVERNEPALRRALVVLRGPEDGRDAAAEAFAWAWEHWDRVQAMDNPRGHLFRVAQSRIRRRRQGLAQAFGNDGRVPEVEPELGAALAKLSVSQRVALVLVHGCEWTYQEVAEALGVSKSSVGIHVARAMRRLRRHLEVENV